MIKQRLLVVLAVAVFSCGYVEGDNTCMTHQGQRGWKAGDKCVFPFTYRGVHYNRCTATGSAVGKDWCCTTPGDGTQCAWGFCNNPGTCKGDYFLIKHVDSGKCLSYIRSGEVVMENCNKHLLKQNWMWDGKILRNRGLGLAYGPTYGLHVSIGSYKSYYKMIWAESQIGQLKVGRSHNGGDFQWTFENGYLKNGWKDGYYGASDLRAIPYIVKHSRIYVGTYGIISTGALGSRVGAANYWPNSRKDAFFKWELEDIN